MNNFIFIGPPGSGKGTQADKLERGYGFLKISLGDILREEVAKKSNLGKQIDEFINVGNLVPDDLICNMMQSLISFNRENRMIFDGFPRKVSQAQLLEKILKSLNLKIEAIINFEISAEILYERIYNRKVCYKCKSSINISEEAFAENKICPHCGGIEFFARDDDKEEIFKKRIAIYEKENSEILKFYENSVKIFVIDATEKIEQVTKNIERFVFPI